MAVTRDQFEAGMTYDAYKAQMTRNREQFEQNEQELELGAADKEAFAKLPRTLNVLALAEDWCGDVIANVPVLGGVAEASGGKLNVRILLRDTEPGATVMNEHLNRGEFKSIPTLVFLDESFNEVGVWIERPDSVTKLREERRQALYKDNPDWGDPSKPIAELPEELRTKIQQATAAIRNDTKPFSNAEVVRELRELSERVSAKATA